MIYDFTHLLYEMYSLSYKNVCIIKNTLKSVVFIAVLKWYVYGT